MTYPNVLVADYVKKARVASPEVLAKAEQYIHVGYQRLLTFEVRGGGFDWCGHGPAVIWLSAYGLHEFTDMARVQTIDPGVIRRTQDWLLRQQEADGTWLDGHRMPWGHEKNEFRLLLTSYVAWSLLESGLRDARLDRSIDYILRKVGNGGVDTYVLALAANALAAWDAKDDRTLAVIRELEKRRQEKPEWDACYFATTGQTLCYSGGDSANVETTALAALAMLKTGQFPQHVSQSLTYLVKSKDANGTWGSTQATILALKALVAGLGGLRQEEPANFTLLVNGQPVEQGEVTPFNADVLQLFDLQKHTRVGKNEVVIQVRGKTNMMYQIVGRHYEPWDQRPVAAKPVLDIAVDYDRTELSTADVLKARATLRYQGASPTFMVIVDLGIPAGFAADPADFDRRVRKGPADKAPLEKYTITARQVTLYLGDVRPGDVLTYEYTLRPKYPLKVQTPPSVAYEYYTPSHRATTRPVVLTVR